MKDLYMSYQISNQYETLQRAPLAVPTQTHI